MTQKIVALGGGHGLYATLTAMRYLSTDVTAVVTVADDGGSSGRLRAELGLIPPGDLRMALAALMSAPKALEDFQTAGGIPTPVDATSCGPRCCNTASAVAAHSPDTPIGNLMLAGLTEVLGDTVAALQELRSMFGIVGQVLPMSTVPLDIEADVSGLEADPRISREIRGQVAVATTPGKVRRVRLIPPEDPPPACESAVEAIESADLVMLGPGPGSPA